MIQENVTKTASSRIRLPLPFDTAPAGLQKGARPPSIPKEVRRELSDHGLHTVCQEAACPNLHHCYSLKRATFLILGRLCTRACKFCNVETGRPLPPDPEEPERVAHAARSLALQHVVVTSVTRDDLPDGGASHFVATVKAIRKTGNATVELLIPDLQGNPENQKVIFASKPEILNHNIETVPELYPKVRPGARWERSLQLIQRASMAGLTTKSGIMVGMGETDRQVEEALKALRHHGCHQVTIGQYLAPSMNHHPVVELVNEDLFQRYGEMGRNLGFTKVESASRVRSSYHAAVE